MSQSAIYILLICEHKMYNDTTSFFIYLVTPWVMPLNVNSKSINQSKQNPIIWSDIFLWEFDVLKFRC